MTDPVAILIFAVFALAGLIKGVLGLGLPTVSMGLLALVMAPGAAAAMMVVPSLVTNFWQMIAGPCFRPLCKRLAVMLASACAGIWLGAGWLTGPQARYAVVALGFMLIAYAVLNLNRFRVSISQDKETWLGPVVGLCAGLIMAGTGVFVPAVIYLQGIGLEKEELVQALGLSFTVSTLALSFNLMGAGVLDISLASNAIIAVAAALVGMWIGQAVRRRLDQALFRRLFFLGLLLLGLYLSAAPLFRA
jgi:uncharacterized membrane protein YfcA